MNLPHAGGRPAVGAGQILVAPPAAEVVLGLTL
jgi:hypothetical protein